MVGLTFCNEDFTYNNIITRHDNFHGKFILCAKDLVRSIGQEVYGILKVFTEYSEVFI